MRASMYIICNSLYSGYKIAAHRFHIARLQSLNLVMFWLLRAYAAEAPEAVFHTCPRRRHSHAPSVYLVPAEAPEVGGWEVAKSSHPHQWSNTHEKSPEFANREGFATPCKFTPSTRPRARRPAGPLSSAPAIPMIDGRPILQYRSAFQNFNLIGWVRVY